MAYDLMAMMNEAINEKAEIEKELDKLIERFTKEEVSCFNRLSSSDIIFICNAIKQAYRYG